MARDFSKPFYDSKKWQKCRESFISKRTKIDGGLCQVCGKRIGSDVDHIIELSESNISNPMISLNHDNLQYLCKRCHSIKTNSKMRVVRFDSDGQPIILDKAPID